MLDHIIALLMIGIGLKSPLPAVLGDKTEIHQEQKKLISDRKDSHENTRQIHEDKISINQDHLASSSGQIHREEKSLIYSKEHADVWAQNLEASKAGFLHSFEQAKQERIEKSQDLRKDFRTKLQTFADAQKKSLITSIDQRITTINSNQTVLMSKQLATMTQILSSVTAKLPSLSGDTTSISDSISSAQSNITTAQSCVTAQASKQYIIPLTSESNAKTDVSAVQSQLTNDLQTCRTQITTARQSVEKTLKALKAVMISSSPTPTQSL